MEIKSFLSEFHLSPLEVVPWLLQEELERDEINALTFRGVKFLAGKGVKNLVMEVRDDRHVVLLFVP